MVQRAIKAALALALAGSIGLHWAFFRSLAWMGMVVSYAQDATLTEALVKTFDGKHPCALCKQIAKGQRSEKKSDAPIQLKKFEFSFVAVTFVFCQPSRFWRMTLAELCSDTLAHPPPVPPPRFNIG